MHPLIRTESIAANPNGPGWVYNRAWHMQGHHQSGVDHTEAVSPYILISQSAAQAEAARVGLDVVCDAVLLNEWEKGAHDLWH